MFEMLGQYMIAGLVMAIFAFGADQYKVIHRFQSFQVQKGVFYDIEQNTDIVSVNAKDDVLLNRDKNSGKIYVHDPSGKFQSVKLTDKNLTELYEISGKSFFFKTPEGKDYYNP